MKYGQIAGSKSVNATIYRCFNYLSDEDERKFVKKFRERPHDGQQVMHTFRELVLGAYLSSIGLRTRYELPVGSQTPDWCIIDKPSVLKGIVEMVNFHSDKKTEDAIETQLQTKNSWVGISLPNENRLYDRIQQKISAYKPIVTEYKVPYVIAVFGELTASVIIEEIQECVFNKQFGLFELYRDIISGVLFFEHNSPIYQFTYIENSKSSRPIQLQSTNFRI